jgi:uncharacterized protein YfaS (alpha-2-macroglobulin family)
MKSYQRGETVESYAEVKSQAGAYITPTSIKVTITDPNGTVQVDGVAMTESATGKYVHYYTLSSSATLGCWTGKVVETDGSGDSAKVTVVTEQFMVVED